MRYHITLLLLFSFFTLISQEEPIPVEIEENTEIVTDSLDSAIEDTIPKYQSLFWKIEHPDYDKPSYLYGTMHVSHKIAYHLNDAFYQALKDVDQIALETNPEDWMDKMLEYGSNPYGGGYGSGGAGLYGSFVPMIPKKDDFKQLLQMNNQIVNSILYRNNEFQQNFEEETYLDMFIFQAGGKMGKPVLALEDIDEADELAKKASIAAYDPKREYSPWLKKKLQEKGVVQLTEDAYRDKNLDLIDSLNREYYPFEYNDYMLYQRNWNMVEAMDSVMRKGTVLVGIGAAHLPGEDGVIDMLRKEGFTVSPIEGELTQKGIDIKENFENNFAERKHSPYHTADDFISLELPDRLYEFGLGGKSIGLSMDITNGAYFLIFRTSTYTALSKDRVTLDDIEGMLYENIPGKIKQQDRVTFQGYPAISIANETKSGEHQKYMIVETPLEFIILKLGGKKNYASINEGKFFDKIKLKEINNEEVQSVSPFYGGFKVDMPKTAIINGNNESLSGVGVLEIQSIDTTSGEYYFAQSMVYHDLKYFEEDKFEVEYLHKVWYDEIDTTYESITTDLSNIPTSVSHSHTKEGKEIWLKSVKKGPRYYMMGTIGVDSTKSNTYFDSFGFVPYIHEDEKFEERIDTSLHFTVTSSVKAPPFFDYYSSRTKNDTIGNIYKNVTFQTPYKEFINVNYRKYHSYFQTENVDSIWANIDRRWINDTPYSNEGDEEENDDIEIFDQQKGKTKEGYPSYSFKVRSKDCSRIIHNHFILNYGVLYTLQFDSDKFDPPSPFVNQFLETFTPTDTLIGRNPLADKKELFFENIYSTDSLTRAQALPSYQFMDFTADDIPRMIEIVKNFKFTDKELEIKVGILEELGKIEDPRVFAYLRQLYTTSEYNSIIQLEVINALAKNANEANIKSILSLLKDDIPLSSERSIESAFSPLRDSSAWEYSKNIFPEILEYSSIPEYKPWIYRLAVILKDAKVIKPKLFKKNKKQWMNEMKIEFKRQKTKELNSKTNGGGYNSYGYGNSTGKLNRYISLLVPHYKDPEVKDLFNKINTLEDSGIKAYLQAQLARNNFPVNQELIEELAADPKTRKNLFDRFKRMKQLDKFPKEYYNQKAIAESFFLGESSYPKIDSAIYIKDIMVTDGDDDYIIYFYRTMKKGSSYGYYDEEKKGDWGVQYVAYLIDEEKEVSPYYYIKSSFSNTDFEDAKEMKELEKAATDRVKYKKRKRVNPYPNYYDDYGY